MSEPQPNQTPNFTRFADWCLHKDSLSTEARHTVEVLLEKAGTCDCYEAEQILTNCTKLDLKFQDICDLSPLFTLTNLTYLDLFGNRISNLSSLAGLTNLTFLELRGMGNQISDLSPLSGLTHLIELNLGGHGQKISDLSPLSGLTNLIKLYIGDRAISDISPLSRLNNLSFLHLGESVISDISPLSGLNNLTQLGLDNKHISDLSPLFRLTNLTELCLFKISISDLGLLIGLTNLNKLYISRKPVFELSYLDSLAEKWPTTLTVPINAQKATEALKSLYTFLGLEEPEIIFFPSPQAGSDRVFEMRLSLAEKMCQSAAKQINRGIWSFLHNPIQNNLPREDHELWSIIDEQIEENIFYFPPGYYITIEELFLAIGRTELLVRELNYQLDQQEQKALQCLNQLFENCGWIFPFEKVCVVCDRPRKISLDTENRLHAEGEPAIVFADGWHTGYYYHGVKLPEKYGKLHPQQWQAQWLLEEDNAELRRILIQSVGYDRICQQLQAQVLDSWQEYTLLRIDADIDVEPIHILKMTCPSTAKIHTLRVPPEINSARVAIRWVNWDIDPEEFSVQT